MVQEPEATPHDVAEERQANGSFPIVGIGASAGGFEAFNQLLSSLPEKTGMAFLLVQHLDPHHESRLTDLLGKATRMPVLEAVHGLKVRADHVYVIPPNTNMAIQAGILEVTARQEARAPHLPVDHLFRSLAHDQQARAIGVVLSGTGSDGTLGLVEIKAVGGITFAQDERTAKHAGMPRSAIDSGAVDFVLSPEEITKKLQKIGGHPYLAPKTAPVAEEDRLEEDFFKKTLATIRKVTGVDFTLYRDTTIRRRILRRMALHGPQTLGEYVRILESDRAEVEALYRDLLINVTSFFRDPDVFESLKKNIYPEIVKASNGRPLRVWVPGCSTGQEAYSLAMSLIEYLGDNVSRPSVQIFATDLSDPTSLDRARAGLYPDTIEAEVSPDRLRRFFKKEDHLYRINKSIRDMCVFARQNIIADPPFSHVDLITCRNVLIYLAPILQKKIVPTFHYALTSPGFLVLGSSETVGEYTDLFDFVDRKNKIYAKKQTAHRQMLQFSLEEQHIFLGSGRRAGPPAGPHVDFQREADRVALGRFAPPGVLVNENFDVIQFRGHTGNYLEPPPGEPTMSILKMAREGLFLELRSALSAAKSSNTKQRRENIRIRADSVTRTVNLDVLPVRPGNAATSCFLVLFEEVESSATPTPSPVAVAPTAPAGWFQRLMSRLTAPPAQRPSESQIPSSAEHEIIQLRQELIATKEYLQSLVEQQDAANEELRSANEEILSSNEELQSTNEELETAKEELQSANEELTTVNEQLQHRNTELNQTTNDLMNLLGSSNLPIVMVGGDMRIRRTTPSARKVMNLLPTDIGRPIGDIKMNVDVDYIEELISKAIETVQVQEREVRDRDGHWHFLRVHPYRTQDHRIEGAVIVLLDVDQVKSQAEALQEADRLKDEFLAMLAHELRNPLTPITNAIELMRIFENDPAEMKRTRQMMQRQLGILIHIVDDLLDVSRVAKGKITLRKRVVSVADIINTAVEMARPYIDARKIEIAVTLPSEPLYLEADEARMIQVVGNLLNNAAKFTDKGGRIWVAASTHTQDGYSVIRVRDTGEGITADLLPKVFDLFVQGRQPIDRSLGGLGVGLSLVKKLVEQHGGIVEASSPGPGKGSEFILRLPLTDKRPEEKPTPPTLAPTERKRVLVVDDDHDAAGSTADLIRFAGHDVRTAFDGLSALEIAVQFNPQVALVDIGLPGMDGYEVSRKMRELPGLGNISLAAVSGYGQQRDRERSTEAGFNEHFIKPVDTETLNHFVATGASRPE